MKGNYKKEFTKNERIQQSSKLKEKNKGFIPVICEKDKKSDTKYIKTRYLLKREHTVSEFMNELTKRLELESHEALFLNANCKEQKIALVGNITFGEIYDKYKDEDGFLYLIYSKEVVWG